MPPPMHRVTASNAWHCSFGYIGLQPLTTVVDAVLGAAVAVDKHHLRLSPQLAVAAHLGQG